MAEMCEIMKIEKFFQHKKWVIIIRWVFPKITNFSITELYLQLICVFHLLADWKNQFVQSIKNNMRKCIHLSN